MSSALLATISLLLASPLQVAGARVNHAAKHNQSTGAFHCPSLCVRCEDGERTVLVHRTKGMLKTMVDIGLATNQMFNPLPGTTLFTGTMVALETNFLHHVADECPDLEILHLEHGEVNKVPDEKLSALLTKDDYLGTFKKDLSLIYDKEQEEKGVSWFWRRWHKREYGQMPDVISSYMDHSDLFCGEHGHIAATMKEKGVIEEGKVQASLSWVPILGKWVSFGEYCEKVANGQETEAPTEAEEGGASTAMLQLSSEQDKVSAENTLSKKQLAALEAEKSALTNAWDTYVPCTPGHGCGAPDLYCGHLGDDTTYGGCECGRANLHSGFHWAESKDEMCERAKKAKDDGVCTWCNGQGCTPKVGGKLIVLPCPIDWR